MAGGLLVTGRARSRIGGAMDGAGRRNHAFEPLLHQQPLIYLMLLLAFGLEIFLVTSWGLRVRASGESMRAALS